MMKKLLSLLLAVLLMFTVVPLGAAPAAAQDYLSSGEWQYKIIYTYEGVPYGEITGYNGDTDKTVIVPSTLDGVSIVGLTGFNYRSEDNKSYIANVPHNTIVSEGIRYIRDAFCNVNETVPISVTLPSTLEFLGEHAFMQCTIGKLTFAEGLIGIDKCAFADVLFQDKALTLPNSLQYLSPGAFYFTNMSAVTLGENVRISEVDYAFPVGVDVKSSVDAGEAPFGRSPYLSTMILSENNPYLHMENGFLYNRDKTLLYQAVGHFEDVTLPDSLREISEEALWHTSFHHLHFGSGLKEISNLGGIDAELVTFSEASSCTTVTTGAFEIGYYYYLYDVDSGEYVEIDQTQGIKKIILPKSITNIEPYAFGGLVYAVEFAEGSQLQEIKSEAFSDGRYESICFSPCKQLKKISTHAFAYNRYIITVDLRGTLCGYDCWFKSAPSLTTVKFTSDEKYSSETDMWGNPVRYECYDSAGNLRPFPGDDEPVYEEVKTDGAEYDYRLYPEYAEITKYNGNQENVVIPSELGGKPVRVLGTHSFEWKPSRPTEEKRVKIRSVSIPDTVVTIHSNAFFNNTLTEVVLPDSVKYVYHDAFSSNNIEHITFGKNITELSCAFDFNSRLTEFTIPDSLLSVTAEVIPRTTQVLHIGNNVSNADFLRGSFRTVNQLTALKEFTVDESNPYLSAVDGVLYSKDGKTLLRYPKAKTETVFTVPDGVERIAQDAFEGNLYLRQLNIADSVSEIDRHAFNGTENAKPCQQLGEVHFGNNQINQLDYTFENMSTLHSVTFGENAYIHEMLGTFLDTAVKSIEIPCVDTVTQLFSAGQLQSVTFREGIRRIGHDAFRESKITKLQLPKSLVYIDDDAFHNCFQLEEVDLGGAVVLGQLAFAFDNKLTKVDLTGVRYETAEWKGTFRGCLNLREISFDTPGKGNTVAKEYLYGNTVVSEVLINGDITAIEEKAFANCENLKTAVISDKVEHIAEDAFSGCNQLTIVASENSVAIRYAMTHQIRYKLLQSFTVDAIPDQLYTGKAIKPIVRVKQGGELLTVNKDYELVYKDNVQVGIAKISIIGKGDYSLFATTVKFNIVNEESKEPAKPKHQHYYSVRVVKPTYEREGYNLYTCSCGECFKDKFTPKLTVRKTAIKKLSKKKKAFTASWKKISGITGYQLQYSTKKDFRKAKTLTAKSASKTVKKLKNNKRYYVRIRAYKKTGGKTYYAAWSKVKSIKTK